MKLSYLGVLLCLLCTACGVTVQGIDLGRVMGAGSKAMDIGEKSEADEIEMGRDTATTLLSKAALADDAALQAYVNRVGYWLVEHTDRRDLPWRFVVLNNSAANAFAAPGGYVFITTGMLANIYNEAELAGVLAHEMAHVIEKHHLIALQDQSSKGLLSDLLILAQQARDSDKDHSRGSGTTTQFDKVVLDLYGRGLSRDDELSADELGALIAARAGYDHYGFSSVLQMLGGQDQQASELTAFIDTHPPTGERLNHLEGVLLGLDDQQLAPSKVLSSRYMRNSREPLSGES